MKYVSTRGGEKASGFSDTVLRGLASDGGLMIPEKYPQLDVTELARLRPLSYPELAYELMRPFVGDLAPATLKTILEATYTEKIFGSKDITPVRPLAHNLYLLGLANGPTLAFKDLAMQFLGRLFEVLLEKRGEVLNILGATSGDTGSAAEYALRGKKNLAVFMLSPKGNMSAFQRAQMYTLRDKNIYNIAVKGLFDDCQDIVKTLQGDLPFKEKYHLGAVNSINWGRILAQIVYYFKAYFAVTNNNTERVSFCVPSGNFGDIFAGHIARGMGLPVQHLVVATNENNVLAKFFTTGIYEPRKSTEVKITSSPSMDIAKASNLERFIFDLAGRDPKAVRRLWDELATRGRFDLSSRLPEIHEKFGFYAGESTHQNRLQTIRAVYEKNQDLIDPHTADAVFVAERFREHHHPEPMIVLETALPIKFAATIKEALGKDVVFPQAEKWRDLLTLPQKVEVLENDIDAVKAFIAAKLKPSVP